MESEELSVFQKHEAAALLRVLNRLRENFLALALYPEATFQLPNLLSRDGCLGIAIDTARAPRRESTQNKQAELLASYQDLGISCFTFAWVLRGSSLWGRRPALSMWASSCICALRMRSLRL
jgi:hypothetical protein